jgi:hypothetical protein
VAAYTALLYHQNRVKALGNSEEGLIFIPDWRSPLSIVKLQARGVKWN